MGRLGSQGQKEVDQVQIGAMQERVTPTAGFIKGN